jgi:chemotaxis protein MotB
MARRRTHQPSASHERWLVSYADFITLMFAFFVVMFASSQADKGRATAVAESVRKALATDKFSSTVAALWGGTSADRGKGNAMQKGPGGAQKITSSAEFSETMKDLQESLKTELAEGKLEMKLELRGLVISLAQAAYFPSGAEHIDTSMYPSLEKAAVVIKKLPNPIRLEGHTDNVPIHNNRFRDNWELSSARSLAMLEFLTVRCGIPESRLTITAHAHTVPADTNDTEQGRARNRRVNLVLLSRYGAMNEPTPGVSTTDKPGRP